MRIIVAHEKHGERYFDATTDEAWAQVSLRVLTDRWNEGHWYRRNDTTYEVTPDELIDALPNPYIRDQVHLANNQVKRMIALQQQENAFCEDVERVVAAQDSSFDRGQPVAWRLLQRRANYQYERLELVKVVS
jgi:hypothetical protein